MQSVLLAAMLVAARTPAPADTVPLYDNLGNHAVTISTKVPLAQQYFNQGMRLTYGFNHGEAIRSFRAAIAADPRCAICWWGVAFALGPNINAPMDPVSGAEAYKAAQEAKRLSGGASAKERAYIDAIVERYGKDPAADRAKRDTAFAMAMRRVADRFPNDQDAQAIAAEAMMDLSPWNYWEKDGRPRPMTAEVVRRIEGVLAANPNHPGACHYYIHAVEAVAPEKAVPCAERLAGLMPGAGHLVHMPAHIYIRTGRFGDAVTANEHAVHTDETYIADQRPSGIYPAGYYPHNYHFLAFAATMSGQSEVALRAAKELAAKVSPEIAKVALFLQAMIPHHELTLVTFGRWEDALRAPAPPADLPVATGLHHYARGTAFAATGRGAEAARELALVQAELAKIPAADVDARRILEIAQHSLQGEMALRGGKAEAAVAHYEAAAKVEDQILYNEPPLWYYPVRESLGQAYLAAGRPADAERAYQRDLGLFPGNVWSAYGLLQAQRAQGKWADAAATDALYRKAAAKADVTLTGSRF
jgi:tetratricopeptide (TPR) repeat protein